MALSVYDIIVPTMVHGLNTLDDYLDHAQNWEVSENLKYGSVLEARLAPDMLAFGDQFTTSCDKAEFHLAKLRQIEKPLPVSVARTYHGLKQRLASTKAGIERINPDELVNAQTHTYELRPPIPQTWWGGDDYIRHLVLPDFFFHISMVHAILRHLGAQVGKRDYLGNLAFQSGGYS